MKDLFITCVLALLLVACPSIIDGQTPTDPWIEDFGDSDLTDDPLWEGDLEDFEVVNGQLRLNTSGSGNSSLWTSYDLGNFPINHWGGWVLLDFNPSGSNRVELYLVADEPSPDTENGLMLRWGESGSDDALEVVYISNGSREVVARGSLGAVALEPSLVRFRVEQDFDRWTLWTSYEGAVCLEEELNWTREMHFSDVDNFYGLRCEYTSSRSDLFYFDDLYCGIDIVLDSVPPVLLDLDVENDTQLIVEFNETLDSGFHHNASLYSLNPPLGDISLDSVSEKSVYLSVESPLESGQEYTFSVLQAMDCSGNVVENLSTEFTFIRLESADLHDVRITELMADPNPSQGLPEDIEWIEIFNRSDKYIEASDIELYRDGESEGQLPAGRIDPGEYVILCDDADQGALQVYGRCIAMTSFPSIGNNGGAYALISKENGMVDEVNWNTDWYQDTEKADGGYTLEMMRIGSLCESSSNWSASNDPSGGTPGRQNSIYDPVVLGMDVSAVDAVNESQINVHFNQGLSPDQVFSSLFALEPFIMITEADLVDNNSTVSLMLQEPMQRGLNYRLTIFQETENCVGSSMIDDREFSLFLPFEPEVGDLLVHEVLFDPNSGGSDFVEIINASDRVLSTQGLILANIAKQEYAEIESSRLLQPGDILVFTDDRQDILNTYIVPFAERLIEQDIPSFNKSDGNVSILYSVDGREATIDSFNYDEDYHLSLLDETKGVSLERLSTSIETNNPDNWISASEISGFATPTGMNSQSLESAMASEMIRLENEVFSPDGDGNKDFLIIRVDTEEVGLIGSVRIFDSEGRQVRSLARNQSFGSSDIIRWTGDTDDGGAARVGRYIVFAQFFSEQGETIEFKETCVLALPLR